MTSELRDKLVPKVRAEDGDEDENEDEEDEEDLVDPAEEYKEKCAEDHCSK